MEKINAVNVNLSAFDSLIRAILNTSTPEQINQMEEFLINLWEKVCDVNDKPEMQIHYEASRDMALKIINAAKKKSSQ